MAVVKGWVERRTIGRGAGRIARSSLCRSVAQQEPMMMSTPKNGKASLGGEKSEEVMNLSRQGQLSGSRNPILPFTPESPEQAIRICTSY